MEFAQPGYLYGLFALVIPVVVHLFNFRKFRKVYFSNTKILRDLTQKTQKQSNLRHLLVLIARMLAMAAIVLAFAQPFFPSEVNGIKNPALQNAVSIYIDNSFSMESVSGKATMLDEAKKIATTISHSFGNSDMFQILTNDFEGKHQRLYNRDEFANLPDEVKFSPVFKNLQQDERTRNIPVIFVTVREDKEKGLKMGARGYIMKPFKEGELKNTIKSIVG